MKHLKIALYAALAILVSSLVSMAQQSAKKRAATVELVAARRIEPLRVINGEMRGSTVTGQLERGDQCIGFSFKITKAEMVSNRLQLKGDLALAGARGQARSQVTAIIAGSLARAANPWPSPRDEQRGETKKSKEGEKKSGEQQQGREAKNPETAGQLGQLAQSTQDTARKTPPAPGEKTEQTQSLYAQAEKGDGCGVLFLKLMLPQQLRARLGAVASPLQLGIVLRPFDNERGREINKQICRFVHTTESRDHSQGLDELNRLLATK